MRSRLSKPDAADERLRVVWVAPDAVARGGISTLVRTAGRAAAMQNWQMEFVATFSSQTGIKQLTRYIRSLVKFCAIVFLRNADIVHIHASKRGSFLRKSVFLWLTKLGRVPVILHIHSGEFGNFYESTALPARVLIRRTLEAADAVVALGSHWAENLKKIAPRATIVALPNPTELKTPISQPDGSAVRFVFLGKLCSEKGVDDLIDAWAHMVNCSSLPAGAELVLAGDGEIDRIQRRIIDQKLNGSCRTTGWLTEMEVDALLNRSHVFVLPSLAEGQPMSILEAMARGLVVVASKVGGIPELLGNEAGILVEPRDASSLSNVIKQVAEDPVLRVKIGKSAHVRVKSRFSTEVVFAEFDRLYRQFVRSGRDR